VVADGKTPIALDAKLRRTGPAEIEGTIQTDVPEVHYNGDQRSDLHFVTQFSRPFDNLGGGRVNPIYEIGRPLYPKVVLHLSN